MRWMLLSTLSSCWQCKNSYKCFSANQLSDTNLMLPHALTVVCLQSTTITVLSPFKAGTRCCSPLLRCWCRASYMARRLRCWCLSQVGTNCLLREALERNGTCWQLVGLPLRCLQTSSCQDLVQHHIHVRRFMHYRRS